MVGKKVTHKIFGVGVVKEIDETSIRITFDKGHPNPNVKRTQTLSFPYPRAFVQFLTAEDAETQKAILAELSSKAGGSE